MSAQIDPRLISFEDAGKLLGGLSASSIRQRKAGTELLTHVPGFGRRVFLIRSEVNELVERKITAALAKERKRQKHLHLVSGAI